MRSSIVIGAGFPDYELSDQSGQRQRLSEIQGHDPMILVLSRGHYCPKDGDSCATWGRGGARGFLAVCPFDARGPRGP